MKHVDPRKLEHVTWRESVRAAIEARIDMWIEMLDALDGEPDLEPEVVNGPGYPDDVEGDRADDEPTLGAPERHPQPAGLTWSARFLDDSPRASQKHWCSGSREDGERELVCEDEGAEHDGAEPDQDGEPDLAARTLVWDQRRGWSDPTWSFDREQEHDGREPDDEGDALDRGEFDEAEHGVCDADGLMEQWAGSDAGRVNGMTVQ